MNAVVCWRISGRFLLSIVIGNQIMHVLAQQGRADPPPLPRFIFSLLAVDVSVMGFHDMRAFNQALLVSFR